jgi:hypothetical protein
MIRIKHVFAPENFFSAKYFLTRAIVLCGLFAIAHLAGLREHTTFLSGTAAGTNAESSAIFGVIYMLLYFGCIVFAPILVLASTLLWTATRFLKMEQPGN